MSIRVRQIRVTVVSLTKILVMTFAMMPVLSVATEEPSLSVVDGYVREMIPGTPNAVAFLTLENTSDRDIKLVSAQSSVSPVVEFHVHRHDNGAMRMERVDHITVTAGDCFTFSPGSYHIMLMNVGTRLQSGDEVGLVLNATDGESVKVTLPVRAMFK